MSNYQKITNSHADIDGLALSSLLYLTLPTLIFFIGFFRPAIGFILAALTIIGLVYVFKLRTGGWHITSPGRLAIIMGVALIWTSLGGAGHFFYANSDWIARDAVLRDLVVSNWPPTYGKLDNFSLILRAPVGYYMPASVLGKVFGIAHADFFLWLWTVLGVAFFLALLPLPIRSPFRLSAALLVVVMFSGMDIIGIMASGQPLPSFTSHIEWWAGLFQYSSNTTLLFWVPNHAIPAWIAAALFFRHWRNHAFPAFAPMMLAALPLWSPFALIGIAPLMLLPAILAIRHGTWSQLRIPYLLPAVGVLIITLQYLTLDVSHIPSGWMLPQVGNPTTFIIIYTFFIAVEFLLLVLVLWRLQPNLPLIAATVILLLLPFWSFGQANDFVMRASIPALTILCATALLCFDREIFKTNRISALALVLILVIGAETPTHEIIRALTDERWSPDTKLSLLDVKNGPLQAFGQLNQASYFGQLNQAGLIWLMKEPKPNRLILKSDFDNAAEFPNGNAQKPNE